MKKSKPQFPMQGDLAAFLLERLAEQGAIIPLGFQAPAITTRWRYQDEEVGFVIVVADNHARAVIELARRIFGEPKEPNSEYPGQTYFTRESDGIVIRVNETPRGMDILCLGLNRNRAAFASIVTGAFRAARLKVASEDFDRPVPPGFTEL